jgi:hypothetical protein
MALLPLWRRGRGITSIASAVQYLGAPIHVAVFVIVPCVITMRVRLLIDAGDWSSDRDDQMGELSCTTKIWRALKPRCAFS